MKHKPQRSLSPGAIKSNDWLPDCPVLAKKSYTTRDHAKAALKRLKTNNLLHHEVRVYKCIHCQAFHLGGVFPSGETGEMLTREDHRRIAREKMDGLDGK